jgi:TolB-like protein/cytochrome c-type biogenesis protein CcmH/NrfG
MGLIAELRRRNVLRMLYIVAAWLIMQVAEVLSALLPGFLPDWFGQATLGVLAVGFPIALILSWFYEITPEGISLEDDVDVREAITHIEGRRLDFIVISLLSAAVILFAVHTWWIPEPPERSVAVLPFVNVSGDSENDHLGIGFAEAILNELAQLPDAEITSLTTVLNPRLEGLSVKEIAALLDVATILEGSVQRQGDRLRITVQLISAKDDNHLWSDNFDRDYGDIFAIQDEIAEAVASVFQIAVREEVRQRIDRESTDNLTAFEAYSRAINNLRVMTTESFFQATQQLQRAVEIDPDFARAHALLGYAYLSEYCCSWMELTDAERRNLARDAANTALQIAPGMSTALTVLGRVTDDGDAKGELYREAVANDPNDTIALRSYAAYQLSRYRTEEAMELAEKLIQLDPLDDKNYSLLARAQRQQSKAHECLKTLARGKERMPESVWLRDWEYWCYDDLGDSSSMIRVKHETLAIDPKDYVNRWMIAQNYFNVGMPEEAARWWERAIEMAPERERDLLRLMLGTTLDVYYQRNDEETFDSLRRWVTEGHTRGFHSRQVPPHYIYIEYGDKLGRLDDVLSTFESLYPRLFTDPPGEEILQFTSSVGEALLRAGDRQRGEPLLNRILEYADRAYSSGRMLFLLRTLLALGDTDAALDEFRALDTASRFFYGKLGPRFVMQNSPVWAPIRATPEYTALMEDLDRNAAEQRKLLQAMDLPIR